ncbi:hypothetical protein SCOR_04975 [Sulfidibacter corallicola]|uniref:Tetratricopeptide repeat protein n=1 Tax=Sulfidibacter corallicola TaxID=2818388 RepID=A0A8A4TQR8_SULCO|nr:hypothetical protein [Sulfidibacter corallicola]QTD51873.1 hypothetical protein J3U87_05325 [Sulfidibacter corallicola]
MSYLSRNDILQLMETMEPQEIRRDHRTRLDEAGLSFLDRVEAELEAADDYLESAGRHFREAHPAGDRPLPQPSPDASAAWTGKWFPNWAVLLLVVLFLSVSLVYRTGWGGHEHLSGWNVHRGANERVPQLAEKNEALARALVERGETLLAAANQQGDRELLNAALADFLLAYELNPRSKTLLGHLARTYELLGKPDKAAHYLNLWETFEE